MGLWEFLRQWPNARRIAGIGASVSIHVLVLVLVLWAMQMEPSFRPKQKPGDSLIVELPKPDEPASAGSPAAPPPSPPPSPAGAPPSPPPAAKATPPPPPKQEPAPKRETPPPRQQEERRVAAAPPRTKEPVAKAPEPAPRSPEPAPRASEPAPAPDPAPRVAETPPRGPDTPPRAAEPAAAEGSRGPSERQVAALPPGGRPSPPSASDVRSALRRGAGGTGQGRGGIDGEPVPLDSTDPNFHEYLEQVRRRIKEKWGFPCVKKPGGCDHYTTSLEIHFGILKNGQVQYVDVVKMSDFTVYDEYAVTAIRLAQPFPPVPPAMMKSMRSGSTGLAIAARFSYVVESSLTNLLR